MRRALLLCVLVGLCSCEPPVRKEPKVIARQDSGGGGATRPGFSYASVSSSDSPARLTADDPTRVPIIGDPRQPSSKKRAKRRARRLPAEGDLGAEDMGAMTDDDPADDDSAAQAKPKEKPEPEPAGPLIERKRKMLEAPPGEPKINVAEIKAMPTEHGHVKFPPPPEGEADQEELDEAMAARNSKLNLPKDGAVKMGADAELSLDPNSLGSYHVQVSLSPYFRENQIDQVYGFGTDVHLELDLDAVGAKTGKYFIRWALIDLLDMEHPFHKPKYFTYVAPVLSPEAAGTSAAPPGATSPR